MDRNEHNTPTPTLAIMEHHEYVSADRDNEESKIKEMETEKLKLAPTTSTQNKLASYSIKRGHLQRHAQNIRRMFHGKVF